MPTENELPAMPKQNAHTISWVNVVARATSSVGTAVASSSSVIRRRPPTRSVRMPSGSRQIDPLRTAIARQPGELHRVEVELVFDRHAEHAEHQPDGEQQGEGDGGEGQDARGGLHPFINKPAAISDASRDCGQSVNHLSCAS